MSAETILNRRQAQELGFVFFCTPNSLNKDLWPKLQPIFKMHGIGYALVRPCPHCAASVFLMPADEPQAKKLLLATLGSWRKDVGLSVKS